MVKRVEEREEGDQGDDNNHQIMNTAEMVKRVEQSEEHGRV